MSDLPRVPTSRRSVRDGARPSLSLVVAWRGAPADMAAYLERLLESAAEVEADVMVAHAGPAPEPVPGGVVSGIVIELIELDEDATYEELRAAGMANADGDIVVICDDRLALDRARLQKLARIVGARGEAPTS